MLGVGGEGTADLSGTGSLHCMSISMCCPAFFGTACVLERDTVRIYEVLHFGLLNNFSSGYSCPERERERERERE